MTVIRARGADASEPGATPARSRTWASLFGTGPVVVDGGLSTQLQARGHDLSGTLWTGRVLLHRPDAVAQAHADFIAAGADVVITASYQVSRAGFVEVGLTPGQADLALLASVAAARRAAEGTAVRVAASVGPYGAILHDGSEYRGDYGLTVAELVDFHRERLDVLVSAGPDLLAIETIPDVREAESLAEALADYPDVPAWMTFSAVDPERVCAGQRIEEAALAAASAPSVVAVGINCTAPQHVRPLVERMREAVDLPIVIYPNAGGVWDPRTGEWSGLAEDGTTFTAAAVRSWLDAGATAVGGCCGTDAGSITRIAQAMGRTAA